MQKLVGSFFNRHAVEDLRPLQLFVDIWFQFYFTALNGLIFTFPSRYLFTIGLLKYLALPVSSGGFPQGIRVLRYSRTETKETNDFRLRDYHPLGSSFPAHSSNHSFVHSSCNKLQHLRLTTPGLNRVTYLSIRRTIKTEFGLFRFRSPLLTKCSRLREFVFWSSGY